ncbi:helix-turn-helix domain-containing protein [Halomicroarcula limicola]|uniref:Helix-turn-helix domain-containing protein n=1 Tax=Haloarcula limicola TaxID=1429915 RepID=A0A8J7Y3Y1_9EURY|nr:helix-turn-helix domain-containing protein [Halomicroarcula limicola]MBV0923945.1 helix-turn-helix domain-containing protein [Halomicroarcula limicola]
MVTIVRGSIPATEFALSHTLERHPDAEFEVERIADSGNGQVMPILWVRSDDADAIEATLDENPTVSDVTLIGDFDGECLYWMQWVSHVQLVIQMLTNSKATILTAFGSGDSWQLRVMYPTRELFAETHEFAADHDIPFEIEFIREMEGEPAGRYGLTVEQHEALVAAARAGYFEVPRETTLEELAESVGVSHQALSERLRRATGALVEDTLLIGRPGDGD